MILEVVSIQSSHTLNLLPVFLLSHVIPVPVALFECKDPSKHNGLMASCSLGILWEKMASIILLCRLQCIISHYESIIITCNFKKE